MFPWKKGSMRLLAYFARKRYFRYFLAVVCTGVAVAFSFLNPQVIRITIDSVLGSEPFALPDYMVSAISRLGGRDFLRGNIYLCALAVIAFSALSGLFNFVRRYIATESAEHLTKNLRDKLFEHIQKLPFDWHIKIQTGDIIQRCTSDVELIRTLLANQLIDIVRMLFLVVFSLIIMFSMDVYMTWVSLALIPIIVVYSLVFYGKVSSRFLQVDEAEASLQTVVQENLTGVRVVRAFGRERFEMNRFDEKNKGFYDLNVHLNDMMAYFWSLGDIMTGLQLIIVVFAGVQRCTSGQMTLGTFLSFYTYSSMLIWPVRALGRIVSELGKVRISTDRIRSILSTEPEATPADSLRPDIKGEITFENVSFSYDGQPVLKDVSFTLKPGTTMAILGGTGSGKSTLVHLLCRMYDVPVDSGRILIDGIDIREIDRLHMRKNVGLVLQESFLFSKSIRDNIRATRPAATPEEVRGCAEIADVDDAVSAFAQGYDTVIGERGVTLSGGQKQRVSIARMLMQKAPIMVFDDALSAVDAQTDARIRENLKAHTQGQSPTTFIISHRINTLMQADIIMVLQDGRIEEMGTHAQLLQSNGTYRRICDMQGGLEPSQAFCTEEGGTI